MHTPAHATINLALLSAWIEPAYVPFVIAGAIAPDLPILTLYLKERLRGIPEARIWAESYQRPFWLNLIHGAHSFVLSAIAAVAAWLLGARELSLFFVSMFLHALGDIPVHHEDAHRHFLPLSQYRFESPFSYWDPRHHARWVALVEWALVIAGAAVLWPRADFPFERELLAVLVVGYGVHYALKFLRRPLAAS